MIVIAIVGIVAIIATTNFSSWQNHYSSVGFQREFFSLCNQARTRSMASSLQQRLRIDNNAETVVLEQGNAGTGSTVWVNAAPQINGTRGAGINDIVSVPPYSSPTALLFNPNGEVLVQVGTVVSPITQADIHLSAASVADQATIRVFGWTSKARLFNGWN
jgi:Tfp pilus assembly protein FimT